MAIFWRIKSRNSTILSSTHENFPRISSELAADDPRPEGQTMRPCNSFTLAALFLAFTPLAFTQTAPSGPYTESCHNIAMKGNTLRAQCQSVDGKWNSVELRNAKSCAQGLTNINGVLSCQTGIIPPGSYIGTCTDFNLHGSTLLASCRNDKGTDVATELRKANLCTGDIANKNGSLKCVALEKSAEKKDEKKDDKKGDKKHRLWPFKRGDKAEKSS